MTRLIIGSLRFISLHLRSNPAENMPIFLRNIAALLLVGLLLVPPLNVLADSQTNNYFVKVDLIDSRIPLKVIKASVPFSRHYKNFNDVDKATYRSYYENNLDGNIPPYPSAGLRQIAKYVKNRHLKINEPGRLFVVANVDTKGKVLKVSVFESPSDDMSKLISAAIWDEKFEVAQCEGQACSMEFVLDWELLPLHGRW